MDFGFRSHRKATNQRALPLVSIIIKRHITNLNGHTKSKCCERCSCSFSHVRETWSHISSDLDLWGHHKQPNSFRNILYYYATMYVSDVSLDYDWSEWQSSSFCFHALAAKPKVRPQNSWKHHNLYRHRITQKVGCVGTNDIFLSSIDDREMWFMGRFGQALPVWVVFNSAKNGR